MCQVYGLPIKPVLSVMEIDILARCSEHVISSKQSDFLEYNRISFNGTVIRTKDSRKGNSRRNDSCILVRRGDSLYYGLLKRILVYQPLPSQTILMFIPLQVAEDVWPKNSYTELVVEHIQPILPPKYVDPYKRMCMHV